MGLFLSAIPVEEAVRLVSRLASPIPGGSVPLNRAYQRVLATDITADLDIPGFDRSVVDGYGVRAAATSGVSESVPAMLNLLGRVTMGTGPSSDRAISSDVCAYVPTGGALPIGADAVVMIEHTELAGDLVLVRRPVAQGENVIRKGEDFSAGEVVLRQGTRISPRDMGALAAVGCAEVPVRAVPSVGVISTGNELVPVEAVPSIGEVRDVNAALCGAFLEHLGCNPVYYGIVRDEREALDATLERAVRECDTVLISGGSSKDDRDMTASIIAGRGEVLVHGIAIAPGKPTIIGRFQGIPVIGLPGHPASTYVVLEVIVRHLITALTGETNALPQVRRVLVRENIPSVRGREEYIRVKIEGDGVYPMFGKSGLLNTLVRSDGLVRVPAGREGFEIGEEVEVVLW
ncbi:MAG: molybdopterin molybdotransferase MoeA [Methanomicrobiales archaeon]|nr:molybdopterin molybdotransferase MoeA [Methanomicrobiales archaeon]